MLFFDILDDLEKMGYSRIVNFHYNKTGYSAFVEKDSNFVHVTMNNTNDVYCHVNINAGGKEVKKFLDAFDNEFELVNEKTDLGVLFRVWYKDSVFYEVKKMFTNESFK